VVYATNTRPQDDDDDSFEEEDFIIASKINATINASVKSYRLVVNKFPVYSGEMILEQGSDWKTITKCVIRDLSLYSDLHTALSSMGMRNENGTQLHDMEEEVGEKYHSEVDDQQAERIKLQIKELIQQLNIK
jgi:hypothetical protein